MLHKHLTYELTPNKYDQINVNTVMMRPVTKYLLCTALKPQITLKLISR